MDMNDLLKSIGDSGILNNPETSALFGNMLKSGFGGFGSPIIIALIALFLLGGGNGFFGSNQCCGTRSCSCSCRRHKHHHKRKCCC